MSITVGIVDDDVLFTEALLALLSKNEQMECTFTALSAEQLFQQLENQPVPDVLLLDLKLGDQNGLETANQLHERFPRIRIIALSSYYKPAYLAATLRSGFAAFLPKHCTSGELFMAIEQVHTTGAFIGSDGLQRLQEFLTNPSAEMDLQFNNTSPLSAREKEILQLICKQFTSPEIADRLFISPRTVEGHRNRIMEKTGTRNTAGLVIYAIANGMVDLSEIELRSSLNSD